MSARSIRGMRLGARSPGTGQVMKLLLGIRLRVLSEMNSTGINLFDVWMILPGLMTKINLLDSLE